MAFETLCAFTRGVSHIKADTPCEDYGMVKECDGAKALVVSDGHGDKSCPRSNVGSKLACEIASTELLAFAAELEKFDASIREKHPNHVSLLLDLAKQKSLVHQLVSSIIGKWATAVVEDVSNHPLTDEEQSSCSQYYLSLYGKNERLEHIYGATLIAALLTERYLLLFQQGDGRCEVFDGAGKVSQPIPWDDRCTANVTTSLCDEDAVESTRWYVVDFTQNEICAVFAGSDGVEDTFFTMEQTHSFYSDLLVYAIDNGVEKLQTHLDSFLPEFSEHGISGYGSQDDVTICGLIDVEKARSLREMLLISSKAVKLKSSLRTVEDRLASMESGKMEYLKRRLDDAQRVFDEAEEQYNKTLTTYEHCCEELSALRRASEAESVQIIEKSSWTVLSEAEAAELIDRRLQHTQQMESESKSECSIRALALETAKERLRAAQNEIGEYISRRKELEGLRDTYQIRLDELLRSNACLDREQV